MAPRHLAPAAAGALAGLLATTARAPAAEPPTCWNAGVPGAPGTDVGFDLSLTPASGAVGSTRASALAKA